MTYSVKKQLVWRTGQPRVLRESDGGFRVQMPATEPSSVKVVLKMFMLLWWAKLLNEAHDLEPKASNKVIIKWQHLQHSGSENIS